MKEINKETKMKLEKLLEGTRVAIVSTANGTAIVGNKMFVLNQLENIAHNLRQCDISEEEAIYAIKLGYNHEEKNETINKKIDKLIDEIIDKFFEEDEGE